MIVQNVHLAKVLARVPKGNRRVVLRGDGDNLLVHFSYGTLEAGWVVPGEGGSPLATGNLVELKHLISAVGKLAESFHIDQRPEGLVLRDGANEFSAPNKDKQSQHSSSRFRVGDVIGQLTHSETKMMGEMEGSCVKVVGSAGRGMSLSFITTDAFCATNGEVLLLRQLENPLDQLIGEVAFCYDFGLVWRSLFSEKSDEPTVVSLTPEGLLFFNGEVIVLVGHSEEARVAYASRIREIHEFLAKPWLFLFDIGATELREGVSHSRSDRQIFSVGQHGVTLYSEDKHSTIRLPVTRVYVDDNLVVPLSGAYLDDILNYFSGPLSMFYRTRAGADPGNPPVIAAVKIMDTHGVTAVLAPNPA